MNEKKKIHIFIKQVFLICFPTLVRQEKGQINKEHINERKNELHIFYI